MNSLRPWSPPALVSAFILVAVCGCSGGKTLDQAIHDVITDPSAIGAKAEWGAGADGVAQRALVASGGTLHYFHRDGGAWRSVGKIAAQHYDPVSSRNLDPSSIWFTRQGDGCLVSYEQESAINLKVFALTADAIREGPPDKSLDSESVKDLVDKVSAKLVNKGWEADQSRKTAERLIMVFFQSAP